MYISPRGRGYSDFCLLHGLGLFLGFKSLNFAICLGAKVLSTIFMGMPISAGIFGVMSFSTKYLLGVSFKMSHENQQNECAPSEDSDQPGIPPSLIRVFAVRLIGSKGPKLSSC